jgi:hypothetical protein
MVSFGWSTVNAAGVGPAEGGTAKFPTTILPDTIILSLVGKIGGTTDVGTGAPLPEGVPGNGPGFVGTSYDQTAPSSGRLFLGFNDDYFGDNSGSFPVLVDVEQPVPSFSSLSAPTITYGTGSTTISGHLNGNDGGQGVPAGEPIQVTLNGTTQTATLDANDDFSTSFDIGTLGVVGSPYTISFSYAGDGTFASASGSSTLTVQQATPTVSVADPGGTYNGAAFPATATVSGVDNVAAATLEDVGLTLTYYAGTDTTGSQLPGAPADPGTYTVQASFAGSGDYTAASAQATFTINGPASISTVSGDGQSATVASGFASPLVTQVTDQYGNPVPNVTVTFTAPSGGAGGTFTGGQTTITATTDSNGQASEVFTANTVAGSYQVTASVDGVGTAAAFNLTNVAGAPAGIDAASGDGQSATVTSPFAAPLVAEVTDQYGNAVAGVSVTLTAPAAGASGTFADNGQTSITLTTDANGQVSEGCTANTVAGTYGVTAAISDGTAAAVFDLTNTPGAPASITRVSGDGQSATVAADFASPLVAQVTDQYGNPVEGFAVTFNVPAGGAGGTFASGLGTITATTDANGEVSESFTANTVTGSYIVTASVSGVLTPATFGLTNTAGAPASINVTSGNGQKATVAAHFAKGLVVTVTDQYGNAVSGTTVTFTAPSIGAGGTFSNGLTTITATTNAKGRVSESFTANTIAGSYTVSASVSGVSTAASFSLTNKAAAPATLAVVQGSGQTAKVNTAFALPLEVLVTDRFGNAVSGVSVTFAAPTTGASGTFTGGVSSVTVVTGSDGLAVTPAFTANSKKGSYRVTARATGLKSVAFSLTNTL